VSLPEDPDAILDLLDEGRLDEARAAYERALRGRPDLDLLLDAADFFVNVAQEEAGDAAALERGIAVAREGAARAAREASPEVQAEFLVLEALGALDLCRFDEARAAAEQAAGRAPEHPWAHEVLGALAERAGDRAEADRRFALARELAPDELPAFVRLSDARFEEVVEDALARLPEPVRRWLANVPIAVEDVPSDDDLLAADPPHSPSILGIFRGAPLQAKASQDPWAHFPSSIALFQRNLERFARDEAELVREIEVTLLHEVGHFLGLDEEELHARGLG
jgi:predicted Zn-dependent protease with MMP-like domain